MTDAAPRAFGFSMVNVCVLSEWRLDTIPPTMEDEEAPCEWTSAPLGSH